MSELIRELFERHQAKLLNLDYEQLKQQFDRHEECFNKRYATFSCFEKEFNVWEACWNTRQEEIDQLTHKANLRESDHRALLVKYQATKTCWENLHKEIEKLKAEKAGVYQEVTSQIELLESASKSSIAYNEREKNILQSQADDLKRILRGES